MSTVTPPNAPTGPRTDDGKRIAARNATTHGLFARDVVLPHLGEDPAGYRALLDELTRQLGPKNLLEQHYTEKIAAASWRLRRLQRWQAQLFEDPKLTEDEVLSRLDRVMRHETTLHRQIDTSVKMMGRELPRLFADRAHQEALDDLGATDDYCARNPSTEFLVASRERDLLERPLTPPGLDLARLDTAPAAQNCQNEPAPHSPSSSPPSPASGEVARNEPEGVPPPERVLADATNCQNEPAPDPSPSPAPGRPPLRWPGAPKQGEPQNTLPPTALGAGEDPFRFPLMGAGGRTGPRSA